MLNETTLNTEIKQEYEQKEILISTGFTVNNQEIIQNPVELVNILTAISRGDLDNSFTEKLIESISSKIVQHIVTNAETIGSYNSLVNIKTNLQNLTSNIKILIGILDSWVPVPMDGGLALSVAIKTVSTAINSNLETITSSLSSLQVEKNII